MDILKRVKLKDNLELDVSYDFDSNNLIGEQFDYGVTFISKHKRYSSYGEHVKLEGDSLALFLKENKDYELVSVYAYIHSDISLSLSTFNCPFDSGKFGYLLFKSGEFGKDNVGLESFINSWNCLLNGEVFIISINDVKTCNLGHIHRETVSADCSIYGYSSIDNMIADYLKENKYEKLEK